MPAQSGLSDRTEVCWQCGAPARRASAYRLKLVAASRHGLDAPGFLVRRGDREDEVEVRVPRCVECRLHNRLSIFIIFATALAGAIIAPMVQSALWPGIRAVAFHQPDGHGVAPAIGIIVGFVAASLGIALHDWLAGRRTLTSYPPVVVLRQRGWHYPVHGGGD